MKQGEAEVAVGATSDWRVSDASQIDAEIRQAIAAGDEARAFRLVKAYLGIVEQLCSYYVSMIGDSSLISYLIILRPLFQAMQRIVQQVATDTSNNRRSIVLSQVRIFDNEEGDNGLDLMLFLCICRMCY